MSREQVSERSTTRTLTALPHRAAPIMASVNGSRPALASSCMLHHAIRSHSRVTGLARGPRRSHIGRMTPDPHAAIRDRVFHTVFEGPGESDPTVRRAVADGEAVPDDLQVLVDKIHRHAYKVTDEDVARLRATYSDDQLFEIVVSAAVGASRIRLAAGLAALEQA
jgi:hypothetical protein